MAAVAAGLVVALTLLAAVSYFGMPRTSSNSTGSLSVMLTDPPAAPAGVTAAYVSYSDVSIHAADAGNASGWYTIASKGTINLYSVINVTQTIGTSFVPSGVYNMVRFNVTGASVTYNGKNYTAFVPSGELKVNIHGGVTVASAEKSGIVLDLTTRIVNIGSASLAEFIITPVAHIFTFSNGEMNDEMATVGARTDIGAIVGLGKQEHSDAGGQAQLTLSAAAVSSTSLGMTVVNSGNESTLVRMVIVTPANSSASGESDVMGTSAVFVVLSNGTLLPIQSFSATEDGMMSAATEAGYNLTAGSSLSLSYSGTITFGALPCAAKSPACLTLGVAVQTIVSGQAYRMTVVGEGAVASTIVTAS